MRVANSCAGRIAPGVPGARRQRKGAGVGARPGAERRAWLRPGGGAWDLQGGVASARGTVRVLRAGEGKEKRGGALDPGGEKGVGEGDGEDGALVSFGTDLDIKFDSSWYALLLGLLVATVGPLLYLMFGPPQAFGDLSNVIPILRAGSGAGGGPPSGS